MKTKAILILAILSAITSVHADVVDSPAEYYGGYMNNASVTHIIQGNDTCFVLVTDASPNPLPWRWLFFPSNTPQGVSLLSELMLAKSKAYTGLGFKWINPAKGYITIPSFSTTEVKTFLQLTSIRL